MPNQLYKHKSESCQQMKYFKAKKLTNIPLNELRPFNIFQITPLTNAHMVSWCITQ